MSSLTRIPLPARLLLVPVLLACSMARSAQPAPAGPKPHGTPALSARILDYLSPLLRRHDLSGIILFGGRDSIVFEQAFGDADAGRPNRPDTRFAIASVTKTFTAGATVIAVEEGLLDLDDTLDRFGFEFPRAGEIRIRHLLTHSSGLANPDYRAAFEERIDLARLVQRIVTQPLQFDPGTKHRYSNAGYNVLAAVIEAATGVTYEEFLASRILRPLGMASTGHDFDGTSASLARGHVPAPPPDWREPTPDTDLAFSFGSGSLYSTAPDLMRWARAIADERLFKWRELEWPYGWGRVEIGPHRGIEQTGATTGFMSSLLVFPDDGLFVIALYNQEVGAWIQVGRGLAAIALGERHDRLPDLEAVGPRGHLERYVGRYRSGGDELDVRARDGHLWVHSNGWPVGKYITPVSDTAFQVRSDMGTIRFRGGPEPAYSSVYWDFGESGTTYERH